jgi:CO/xanthine dehydrogenase FAD-binding subunit
MRPLDYIAPKNAKDAVALLLDNKKNSCPLAGGTDLIVDLKHNPGNISMLIDVSCIEEFRGIEETKEGLKIGSMVTFGEIMSSPLCQKYIPAVIEGAHTVGAVQTRNLGTVGGNLVTCVPSADSAPSLMVLESLVTIVNEKGNKTLPIEDFFVGPRKTILKPHELLANILIPKNNLGKPSKFLKHGLRKGQALALVNAAASLFLSKTDVITEPKIALGAVAPTPLRATKAEKFLEGKKYSEELINQAAEIAMSEAKPIDDFRASAKYRSDIIKTFTKRVLLQSIERAKHINY